MKPSCHPSVSPRGSPPGSGCRGGGPGRFSPGARQTRLVSGPHGRAKSGAMPLTMGSRRGKEGARVLRRVMLLPTSPSSPALAQQTRGQGSELATISFLRYHPEATLHTTWGRKETTTTKPVCRGTPVPRFILLPSQPIDPKVSIPHLRQYFPVCVLCLAHFTHSCRR